MSQQPFLWGILQERSDENNNMYKKSAVTLGNAATMQQLSLYLKSTVFLWRILQKHSDEICTTSQQ